MLTYYKLRLSGSENYMLVCTNLITDQLVETCCLYCDSNKSKKGPVWHDYGYDSLL